MAIEPFHCKEVYFYKKDYSLHNYRYVVASHGYDNTEELLSVWNEQKAAGNAWILVHIIFNYFANYVY